jgi:hypothetical protein
MEVKGQLDTPATLPLGIEPHGTCWMGYLVGPTANLYATEIRKISCPSQKLNSVIHCVAYSLYRLSYPRVQKSCYS